MPSDAAADEFVAAVPPALAATSLHVTKSESALTGLKAPNPQSAQCVTGRFPH
jgi:hypothetical protein